MLKSCKNIAYHYAYSDLFMSILSTYLQLLVLNGHCAVALGGQGAKNETHKLKLLQKYTHINQKLMIICQSSKQRSIAEVSIFDSCPTASTQIKVVLWAYLTVYLIASQISAYN